MCKAHSKPEVTRGTNVVSVGIEKAPSNNSTIVAFLTSNTAAGLLGFLAILIIHKEWTAVLVLAIVTLFVLGLAEVVSGLTDGTTKTSSPQPCCYCPRHPDHQLWMRIFNRDDTMYRVMVFLTLSTKVASGASNSSKMDKTSKEFLVIVLEAILGTGVVYAAFRFVVHRLTSYIDARTEQELEEADVEASENGQTSDELHDESSGESVQGEQAGALPPSPPNLSRVKSVRRSVTEVVYEYYEPV